MMISYLGIGFSRQTIVNITFQAPEARHRLAQPVRAGLKGKKMASTVGAAPNQKHISDQTRLRVFSTTQQTPHQNPFSCDVVPDSGCTESRRESPTRSR